MDIKQEFLAGKHCIKFTGNNGLIFLVVVHLKDFESFFDFLFDHNIKPEILELEIYRESVENSPKIEKWFHLDQIKNVYRISQVPVCLWFDELTEPDYKTSITAWLK